MVGGKNPAKKDELLVNTIQMNSTFRARWLASLEVISQVRTIHLRAAEEKQNNNNNNNIYLNTIKITAELMRSCIYEVKKGTIYK